MKLCVYINTETNNTFINIHLGMFNLFLQVYVGYQITITFIFIVLIDFRDYIHILDFYPVKLCLVMHEVGKIKAPDYLLKKKFPGILHVQLFFHVIINMSANQKEDK